jgi:hypothetical protein
LVLGTRVESGKCAPPKRVTIIHPYTPCEYTPCCFENGGLGLGLPVKKNFTVHVAIYYNLDLEFREKFEISLYI